MTAVRAAQEKATEAIEEAWRLWKVMRRRSRPASWDSAYGGGTESAAARREACASVWRAWFAWADWKEETEKLHREDNDHLSAKAAGEEDE